MAVMSKEERTAFLKEINDLSPDLITWEDDGYYAKVIVLKAKNYILYDPTKELEKDRKQVKGSAFKSSTKEPATVKLMQDIIDAILLDKQDTIVSIYERYVEAVISIKDINAWCSKKTVTDKVLAVKDHARFNKEQLKAKGWATAQIKQWEAVKNEPLVQQGDKVYVYPAIIGYTTTIKEYKNGTTKEIKKPIKGLKLAHNWDNDHNIPQLLKRLHATMEIFGNILDIDQFTNYSLVKNYKTLMERER